MHAKDNAVSAFGKIIRYQSQCYDTASLIPTWLSLLPIKNDMEEAKIMNEFVALFLTENPLLILGQQYQRFDQVIILLSDIYQKKYLNDETIPKLQTFIHQLANDGTLGPQFQVTFNNKLTTDQQERI